MSDLWGSIAVVVLLFFIGGLFSAAEMALVSLRESQLAKLTHRGKRGKAIAKLTENPNRFLSAVQIGVTLAGFMSSAYGSDSLANKFLAPWLAARGVPGANGWAILIVTALISFFSIVLSELTAKRLAMQRPEAFALALAPMVNGIAILATPLIWLLGKCTNVMVRVLGGDPDAGKESVSDEEIRSMVASSESLGAEERQIVDDVFDAGDRSLREVMVPRTEVDSLSGDLPAYKAIRQVQGNEHSRYPVIDGSPDHVLGFLHVRDLMGMDLETRQAPIRQLVRPVLSLPETVKVLHALSEMRRSNSHLAIVVDEYGGTSGIVTLEDLVEELIGDINDEYDIVEEHRNPYGRREVAGLTSLEDFEDLAGLQLPEGPYDTVAGFVMAQLGRVPAVGDSVVAELPTEIPDESGEGFLSTEVEFLVDEMDGRRVAWLSVRRREGAAAAGATAAPRQSGEELNEQVQLQDAETRVNLAIASHQADAAEPGI